MKTNLEKNIKNVLGDAKDSWCPKSEKCSICDLERAVAENVRAALKVKQDKPSKKRK